MVHDWKIPDREYARQDDRRGRRHAFEHLDPNTTALVVVDMTPSLGADRMPSSGSRTALSPANVLTSVSARQRRWSFNGPQALLLQRTARGRMGAQA